MIEPAVAILVRGQKKGVFVAGSRPTLFVLAPERGGEPPDVGIGQAAIPAPCEMLAKG